MALQESIFFRTSSFLVSSVKVLETTYGVACYILIYLLSLGKGWFTVGRSTDGPRILFFPFLVLSLAALFVYFEWVFFVNV